MRTNFLLLRTVAIGFLFLGCSREIVIPAHNTETVKKVPWQQHTPVKSTVEHAQTTKQETADEGESITPLAQENVVIDSTIKKPKQKAVHVDSKRMERVPFPISEYKALPRQGKGSIRGSIYVKNGNGKKVFGKSTRLYLNPVTSYSTQWYEESYISGYKLQKEDGRLYNYLRITASDSEGKFAFHGVPSGHYYISGTVKCASECGYDHLKSIRIAGKLSISGNQVIQTDLKRLID